MQAAPVQQFCCTGAVSIVMVCAKNSTCSLKERIVGVSNATVHTTSILALQNACWGRPQILLFCIFQCRLRFPAGRFLAPYKWLLRSLLFLRKVRQL